MNDCCKHAKWWPHNWLCLKGLYVFFIVMFYLTLVVLLVQDWNVFHYPLWASKQEMWMQAVNTTLNNLAMAIAFLTIAKILKALRKIKKAVAPCCCEKGAQEEKAAKKEDKKAVAKEEKSK
jgi:hypothetical protein